MDSNKNDAYYIDKILENARAIVNAMEGKTMDLEIELFTTMVM